MLIYYPKMAPDYIVRTDDFGRLGWRCRQASRLPLAGGLLKKLQDGFGAGADMQLFVDVMEMSVDGGDADGEMCADFLARITFGELLENFLLAVRKLFILVRIGSGFAEGFDHAAGDLAAHGRAALLDFLNGEKDVGRVGTLEQITAGTGFQCSEDAIVIFIHSQNEDLDRRTEFLEFAGAVHAGHAGQMNVHEHDIRQESWDYLEGILG